jgi:membrane associated rhomboid family serine protease
MLIPLTHEHATARRWPFVTLAIVLACVAVLIVTEIAMQSLERDAEASAAVALAYFEAHPYLDPTPPLDRVIQAQPPRRAQSPASRSRDSRSAYGDPTPQERAAEQAKLDVLCADLNAILAESPLRRYGYVPKDGNVLGLFTSQFMHGGWMHLGFNMWFLWLCGCNLEDKWGRAVFVPFYLSAGVVAALAHAFAAPMSDVPLVGASGAIAGAMGAFLVSFTKTKIRFFYFYFRAGTFDAPAYVMLPLWLGEQLVYGMASTGGDGTGVAYFAHVGGFLYGIAFAAFLKLSGLERKLDDAVEAKVTVSADPRLLRAGELIDSGGAPAALAMLDKLGSENPSSIDVQLEILRGAKVAGDAARELRAYARLMALYTDAGAPQTATDLYTEAQSIGLHEKIPTAVRMRVAEHLAGSGQPGRGLMLLETIVSRGIVDSTSARAAVLAGQLASAAGRYVDARTFLESARASQLTTPDLDLVIGRALEALPPT